MGLAQIKFNSKQHPFNLRIQYILESEWEIKENLN